MGANKRSVKIEKYIKHEERKDQRKMPYYKGKNLVATAAGCGGFHPCISERTERNKPKQAGNRLSRTGARRASDDGSAERANMAITKIWRIRGRFTSDDQLQAPWDYVKGRQLKCRGIRLILHRCADGGKGYTLTEPITGLKVCNVGRAKDAAAKADKMHDAVAQAVQKLWDEQELKECANEMTHDEYEALCCGVFGKEGQV